MEFERLKEIIVDTLACDEDKVTLEADMQKDLEVDSLSLVELHMALEDELGVSIPDGEITQRRKFIKIERQKNRRP